MVSLSQREVENKTDEEIVILTLNNRVYYDFLINRYIEKLTRYIQRISNFKKEDAEDILQEVFLKCYINLNDFDNSLKFSSWIYRITHNETISYFRKNKKHKDSIVEEDFLDIFRSFPKEMGEELKIDMELNKTKLLEVFNKMDIKYKEVLVLKFLEEKSYNEISDILKKPIGTISTMINRAKKQFKKVANDLNINFNYE